VTQPFLSLPTPLRHGDRVRLVAASSALDHSRNLDDGVTLLRRWGLDVEGRSEEIVRRRWGYYAGRDHERRSDLHHAPAGAGARPTSLFACVRGGWGSARLLERSPDPPAGWLLGFSDVTSLLWDRVARGRGGGIHGPLLTTLAAEPDWSQERLRRLLFGGRLEDLAGVGWCPGVAEGRLLVANLTVATHLLGTPHLPDLGGAILIFEDVGEAPYRIDRMLTHWRLAGALRRVAGIGFGGFTECDPPEQDKAVSGTPVPGPEGPSDTAGDGAVVVDRSSRDPSIHRFHVEEVLRERTADLGIPVLAGLPVGHVRGNAALPLGVPARLDADRGVLALDLPPPWG
jgi:muramoyltetrapeptide carboxypeptidase